MEKILEEKKCRDCEGIFKSIEGDNIIELKCKLKDSLLDKYDLMTCIIYEDE